MLRRCSFALCFAVMACGGSGGDDDATPDAPAGIDAPAATVVEVAPCPTTPDATVITMNFAYMPKDTTITQGQVVKFDIESSHDVNGRTADPGLVVGFGETKCLRFTKAGTFAFHCTPHGFSGSIIVN